LTRAGARVTLATAPIVTSAAVDVLIAAAWIVLAADNLRLARRERAARTSVAARAARLGFLVVLLSSAALLERWTGGRFGFHPLAAAAGVVLAGAGLVLHLRARRTLGARWSSAVRVQPGHQVVTSGPYAVVRHPLYLGVLLLAAGTVLAHPSTATLCIAGGLALGIGLKIPAEERSLRAHCGDAWRRYAAAVPALLPRPSRVRAALLNRAGP
jgi:protein-S-isoprenylcysteine O-methyltransferase Ste14